MKRAFIRSLWGVYDDSHRVLKRRYGMDEDIRLIKENQFSEPFITYVFGEDNLKKLNSQGVDNCVLLTKEPFAFDLVENQYRNKLQVWKQAMEDFDEIVFLDWDLDLIKDFLLTTGKSLKKKNLSKHV